MSDRLIPLSCIDAPERDADAALTIVEALSVHGGRVGSSCERRSAESALLADPRVITALLCSS